MNCPTCLDQELLPVMGLAPGLEDTVTLYQCSSCNSSWTPYALDRRWTVDGQIRDCYLEDCRRGSHHGGSGGCRGRNEDKPGIRLAREERRRARTLDIAPLGAPDPDPWAKGCDRLTSSVHSVRLSAEERERLARLREAYGGSTDAEALRRALEVADAVESARPKEAA